MKVIAFILTAYLVFLFAIPCCSFDNCPDENVAQTENHEKGDGDCGSCSPFFTCSGCSGFAVSSTIHSELIIFISHNQYAEFIVSSMPDADHDFWQPPKIG